MKIFILFVFVIFSQLSFAKRACVDPDKFPVCHAGSEKNPNYVNICVDFAALWGHFSNHSNDYYGECLESSADIVAYTCNAGLKFKPSESLVCKNLETGLFTNTCTGIKNCVCSALPSTEEQFRLNYFTYLIAPFFEGDQFYVDEFDFEALGYTEKATLSGYDLLKVSSPVLGKYVLEKNGTTEFHFGSERFGNTYFVDTCFRYVGDFVNSLKIKFSHQNMISSENNTIYRQKADLKQKYELFCDHSTSTNTDYVVTDPVAVTPKYSFSGTGLLWNQTIPLKKFCFIRTTIEENSLSTELRPNTLQTVEFQNNTQFSIDGATVSNPYPLNLCYIENSTGCCKDYSFNSEEHFKDFIISIGNTGQRNSSFRGACSNSCKRLCR